MMGWIIALCIVGLVLGGLRLSARLSRQAFEIAVVAMIISLAGYGWQGSPDMGGSPIRAPSEQMHR